MPSSQIRCKPPPTRFPRPTPPGSPARAGDPVEPALDAQPMRERSPRHRDLRLVRAARAYDLASPCAKRTSAGCTPGCRTDFVESSSRRLDAISSGHGLPDLPESLDDDTPLHQAYETVKLFATLSQPKGHANTPWAARHLAGAWRSILPDGEAVPEERLIEHARNYLAALEANPGLAWPAGRALASARDRLRGSTSADAYRRILLAATDAPAVRASAVFSPTAIEFLASRGRRSSARTVHGIRLAEGSRGPAFTDPASSIGLRRALGLGRREPARRRPGVAPTSPGSSRRIHPTLDVVSRRAEGEDSRRRDCGEGGACGIQGRGDGFYRTLLDQFEQRRHRDDEPGCQRRTTFSTGFPGSPPNPTRRRRHRPPLRSSEAFGRF